MKFLTHTIAVFLAGFVLAGCTTATVEQRQSILNSAKITAQKLTLKDSEQSRKPVKAGQWVTLLIDSLNGDSDLQLRTIKILEVKDKTTRLEIDTQSALKNSAVETEGYIIENYPLQPLFEYTRRQFQSTVNAMSFQRVITKKADKEQEIWPDQLLGFNKNWLDKIVVTGYVPDDVKPQAAPCTSEYIDSKVCFMYPQKLRYLDTDTAGRVYAHSEVPVVGFVHAADEYHSYKVIAFGEDGATARLNYTEK